MNKFLIHPLLLLFRSSFRLTLFLLLAAGPGLQGQMLPGGSELTSNQKLPPESRQETPTFTELMNSVGESVTLQIRDLLGHRASEREVTWNSNESPRDTVFTFIEGMQRWLREDSTDAERIQKTLPPGYAHDSKEARALYEVFARLGKIPPILIIGREEVMELKLKDYEVFPFAVDHRWIWNSVESPPRQTITLKRSADDGSWRFSEQTLASAPDLLEVLYGIAPVYGNEGDSRLVGRIFVFSSYGSPWLAGGIFLAGLGLAWFLGRWINRRLTSIGEKLEGKTRPVIGVMMRSISTSLAILAGIFVVIISSAFIDMTPILADLFWAMTKAVLLFAVIWFFFGLSDLAAALVKKHFVADGHEYGRMAVTIVQRVVRSVMFVILAFYLLQHILGINVAALITGLGIIGLALSLAGKETAQNLFGAISIFVNRPFVVGDWIEFKGEIGVVEDVRMQASHIRLLSGGILIVPNMQFISNSVENLAMRKYLRREMNIAIPYGTPPDKVDEAMQVLDDLLRGEAVTKEGKCDLDNRPPIISFSDFGNYYLNLKIYYWYFIGDDGHRLQRDSERGWFSYLEHCSIVNKKILRAFDEHGIEFAFPTQTIDLQTNALPGEEKGHSSQA